MIIQTRKNRKTGATITLHDRRNEPCIPGTEVWWRGLAWQVECCSHGWLCDCDTKKEALTEMAHPDNWCVGCIEGWEIDDDDPPTWKPA